MCRHLSSGDNNRSCDNTGLSNLSQIRVLIMVRTETWAGGPNLEAHILERSHKENSSSKYSGLKVSRPGNPGSLRTAVGV